MMKEDNFLAKYNYQSVKMLLGKINQVFGKKFKYKNFGIEGICCNMPICRADDK